MDTKTAETKKMLQEEKFITTERGGVKILLVLHAWTYMFLYVICFYNHPMSWVLLGVNHPGVNHLGVSHPGGE